MHLSASGARATSTSGFRSTSKCNSRMVVPFEVRESRVSYPFNDKVASIENGTHRIGRLPRRRTRRRGRRRLRRRGDPYLAPSVPFLLLLLLSSAPTNFRREGQHLSLQLSPHVLFILLMVMEGPPVRPTHPPLLPRYPFLPPLLLYWEKPL